MFLFSLFVFQKAFFVKMNLSEFVRFSADLPTTIIFEKCNELGCSFTEYIAEVVRASLEDDKSDLEPKETKPVPKLVLLD